MLFNYINNKINNYFIFLKMNDFIQIKDIDGKIYLSIENNRDDVKKDRIGNTLDDFEFLQELGEGHFGKVYKVISKLNNKIYAMKTIDLEELNPDEIRLTKRESLLLTALSHPHIIKYYKNFKIGDILYIIFENAENGDLYNLIEAYKINNKHIPEEELWSIFLQCMQGLAYIHEKGVIHRDIKPGNILMDNNLNIKIGDFGTAAVKKENKKGNNKNVQYLNETYLSILDKEDLQYGQTFVSSAGYTSPEMKKRVDYDQKIDVYSMGVTFYEMCYLHNPSELGANDDVDYSDELLNIIKEMIEEDKNKRQTSKYFLEKIKEEFSKKYDRNTSIDSIVRCLYACKDITRYYKNLTEDEIQNKPATQAFIKCLNTFKEQDMIFYVNSIKYFREIICTENKKFDRTKEINPKLVLAFLTRQLHNEINYNVSSSSKANNYYIKSVEDNVQTNDVEMMINFQTKFENQLNSCITQKIMVQVKTTYKCKSCQMKTYSFKGDFFINIDLEKIIGKINFDIKSYFEYKNNYMITTEKYCPKCLMIANHEKYEEYSSFPDYLIVIINRGKNDSIRIPFNLMQKINLVDLIGIKGKKYKLVGFINRNYETENYVSYVKIGIKKSKKWFKCKKEEVIIWEPDNHSDMFDDLNGELMMAFYEAV